MILPGVTILLNKAEFGQSQTPVQEPIPQAPVQESTPQAPTEAQSTQPQPTGQPRPAHKYIKREWTGTRWQYTYPEDVAAAHGPLTPSTYQDPTRAHTVEAPEDLPPGMDPEQAYHQTVGQIPPGTKNQLPHPSLPDHQIEVSVRQTNKGNKFDVTHDGVVKTFDSRGAFERWYLGTQNTELFYDHKGNLFLEVKPNVGRVENGELVPSTDPLKAWVVQYHESWPEEKRRELRRDWRVGSKEGAIKRAQKMINDERIYSEQEERKATTALGAEAAIPAPGVETVPAAAPEVSGLDESETKALNEAKEEMEGEPHPHSRSNSVGERLHSGKFKWKPDPKTGKRRLDVSPEERQKLVSEAAKEYWPKLVATADFITENPFFKPNKKEWMERFIGDDIPEDHAIDKKELKETGRKLPSVAALDPDSPGYRAISDALDSWNPNLGVGFTGWLTGKKNTPESGLIYYRMLEDRDKFISEIKAHGATEIEGEEGEFTPIAEMRAPTPEEISSRRHLASPAIAEEGDIEEWEKLQTNALDRWGKDEPPKGVDPAAWHKTRDKYLHLARQALREVKGSHDVEKPRLAMHFADILSQLGGGDYAVDLKLSLTHKAIMLLQQHELMTKAMDILTKDPKVDPNHSYAFKEGDDDNPKFFYTDPQGNLIRYTNAPTGHPDRSRFFGDAEIHPSEPRFDKNPEYFTTNGMKLNRVPEVPPEQVEWNQSYNKFDPKNLWIGKWRNSQGSYQYTYLHNDIRQIPKLQIHNQNTILDARLPQLRKYISDLFVSDKIKDQITAIALALMDQGGLRVLEISSLFPIDVHIDGPIVTLGKRKIYADYKLQRALEVLISTRLKEEPLFSIPQQNRDGKFNDVLHRRIGPQYLSRVLDSQGVSILSLQTYRGTITFSREVTRYMTQFGSSWEQAKTQALFVVGLAWGHDFSMEPDPLKIVQLIEQALVDPVAISTIEKNAQAAKLIGSPSVTLPSPMVPIPVVSMDLTDRTLEEQEFSDWIHSHPIHENVEVAPDGGYKSFLDLIDLIKADPYHDPKGRFTSKERAVPAGMGMEMAETIPAPTLPVEAGGTGTLQDWPAPVPPTKPPVEPPAEPTEPAPTPSEGGWPSVQEPFKIQSEKRLEIENFLSSADVAMVTPLDFGVRAPTSSSVRLVSLNTPKGSIRAIFKPQSGEEPGLRPNIPQGTYHQREIIASKLADQFGVEVPPTTQRSIDYTPEQIRYEMEDRKKRADWYRNKDRDLDNQGYSPDSTPRKLMHEIIDFYDQYQPESQASGSIQHWVDDADNCFGIVNSNKALGFNQTDAEMRFLYNIDRGGLERMRVMDAVLGNTDRNTANILWKEKSGTYYPVAIDHGLCLPNGESNSHYPAAQFAEFHAGPLLDETKQMISNLDPNNISKVLSDHGIEKPAIDAALHRLDRIKKNPSLLEVDENDVRNEIGTRELEKRMIMLIGSTPIGEAATRELEGGRTKPTVPLPR